VKDLVSAWAKQGMYVASGTFHYNDRFYTGVTEDA